MQSIKDILLSRPVDEKGRFISQEFQDYGYRLALELDDLTHKSLYIKLAKTVERHFLEEIRCYVADYPKVKNKGRLFMWKLSELRKKKRK